MKVGYSKTYPIIGKVKSMKDGKRLPEYAAWHAMRHRCIIPTHHAYKDYGGRGIKVCERWINSFENFIADMGFRPSEHHTLERIENDKDYCKENCKWATMKDQCNNRRSNNWIEYNGERKTISEWALILRVNRSTILKKRDQFEQMYTHAMTGGYRNGIRIEFNGSLKKISEWASELTISDRHFRNLLKNNSFSDIYNKYKK